MLNFRALRPTKFCQDTRVEDFVGILLVFTYNLLYSKRCTAPHLCVLMVAPCKKGPIFSSKMLRYRKGGKQKWLRPSRPLFVSFPLLVRLTSTVLPIEMEWILALVFDNICKT